MSLQTYLTFSSKSKPETEPSKDLPEPPLDDVLISNESPEQNTAQKCEETITTAKRDIFEVISWYYD